MLQRVDENGQVHMDIEAPSEEAEEEEEDEEDNYRPSDGDNNLVSEQVR